MWDELFASSSRQALSEAQQLYSRAMRVVLALPRTRPALAASMAAARDASVARIHGTFFQIKDKCVVPDFSFEILYCSRVS